MTVARTSTLVEPWRLVTVAAGGDEELEAATADLRAAWEAGGALPPDAGGGPEADGGPARRFLVCRGPQDAVEALGRPSARAATAREGERPVAFMFPGGGAQHVGMAAELYESAPVFREHADHCAELFVEHFHLDVREALRPEADPDAVAAALLGLSALFTVEYALARLWLSLGVQPAALIGHSLGEYVAATIGGVLALEDAVAVVAQRCRLMNGLPAGAMLSVRAREEELEPLLRPGLGFGAINAPAQCVLSGAAAAVDEAQRELGERGTRCTRLRFAAGAHSPLIDGILDDFGRVVERMTPAAPRVPCVSNVSGTWLTDDEARDPRYWVRHLRAPVRFADGLGTLRAELDPVLLEVGPGTTLCTLARANGATAPPPVASLRHPLEDAADGATVTRAAGELWLAGARFARALAPAGRR